MEKKNKLKKYLVELKAYLTITATSEKEAKEEANKQCSEKGISRYEFDLGATNIVRGATEELTPEELEEWER